MTQVKRLFFVFSLLFLFPGCLMSQEGNLADMSLEDLLNVPIVAASAVKEKPSESAAAAYVVSEETIKNRGYTSLIDLLEDIPQIEIAHLTGNAHANTLTIQGVNGDRRFQIMIDGVRVSPVAGSLYPLGRQFSLRNAKQVEIILGPMSALYGADVFTGVINIVTRTGEEMKGRSLNMAGGTNQTRDYSITLGDKFERNTVPGAYFLDGGSFAITAQKYTTDGPFLPKAYPKEFSWYNNEFQSGRVSNFPGTTAETNVPFKPYNTDQEAGYLHGRLNLKNLELGFISMTESHSSSLGVSPAFSLYDINAVFRTNYLNFYGKHNYASRNEKWKLRSQISHQLYEVDPRTLFLNNFSSYKPAYKYAKDESFSIEEQLSYSLPNNQQMLLGLSYQRISSLPRTADLPYPFDPDKSPESQGYIYSGSDLSTINPQGIPMHFNKTDYTNFGGYAQLHLRSNSICTWTLGARYDSNSMYGSTFNPRIGVVLKPNDKVNFKLLYGTAFLAPPTDKVYQDFGSFSRDKNKPGDIKSSFFHIPNPDLKPEKIKSTQTEVTYSFNDDLRLTLSGYDSRISDIQQVVSLGSGTYLGKPVKSIQSAGNRGEARTYGGSLRIDSLKKFRQLRVNSYLAYSYSNGDLDGEMLPFSARHSIKAGASFIKGKWTFSPRLIYQGRSYSQAKDSQGKFTSSDPFTIVNMYLKHVQSTTERFTISEFINITNLTDARYYNPDFALNGVGFTANPQEPRSIVGGISVEF
ncbi:MAG: TonB-dependent receptor [Candidatus Riflebacteria bacterium]|nr:TonB-dependent receptor [Candidatus Riflebacteria bacterium]